MKGQSARRHCLPLKRVLFIHSFNFDSYVDVRLVFRRHPGRADRKEYLFKLIIFYDNIQLIKSLIILKKNYNLRKCLIQKIRFSKVSKIQSKIWMLNISNGMLTNRKLFKKKNLIIDL